MKSVKKGLMLLSGGEGELPSLFGVGESEMMIG